MQARTMLSAADRWFSGKKSPAKRWIRDPFWRDSFIGGLDLNFENSLKVFNGIKDACQDQLLNLLDTGEGMNTRSAVRSLLPMAPYLVGFHTEYRDKPLMRTVRKQYLPDIQSKVAVFTDVKTHDVRDSVLLQHFMEAEAVNSDDLFLFGLDNKVRLSENSIDFKSLGQVQPLPDSDVAFKLPPIFDVLRKFSEGDYHLIYIHTFGSMGILGLLISKLVRVPVICQYPYTEIRSLQINSASQKQAAIVTRLFRTLLKWCDKIRVDSDLQYKHAVQLGAIPDPADIEQNLSDLAKSWINPFSMLGQSSLSAFELID